jgi:PhnB protein
MPALSPGRGGLEGDGFVLFGVLKIGLDLTDPLIPADHQQVMPYLVIKEADDFSGEQTIAHAEITIGESVIMLSGDTRQLAPCMGGGFIYVPDADETYNKAIKAGATSVILVKGNPYGRSGGFTDPFGNTWWVKTYRTNL